MDFTTNLGKSAFWIVIIFSALLGLSYLGIWSYHNNSIRGAIISSIFFSMIIVGIVFSKLEVFNWGNWSDNCISFVLSLSVFMFLGSRAQSLGTNSVFAITKNPLLESIAAEMPRLFEFIISVFVAPASEELFWLIAIPSAVFTVMTLMGKQYAIFKNFWLQLAVVVAISGITFALFHVGKLLLSFLIVAFIFRAITLITVYSDMKIDLFPKINLVGSFALGAHIGYNWGTFGVAEGISLLAYGGAVGILILGFFGIVILTVINEVSRYLLKITGA